MTFPSFLPSFLGKCTVPLICEVTMNRHTKLCLFPYKIEVLVYLYKTTHLEHYMTFYYNEQLCNHVLFNISLFIRSLKSTSVKRNPTPLVLTPSPTSHISLSLFWLLHKKIKIIQTSRQIPLTNSCHHQIENILLNISMIATPISIPISN